MDRNKFNAAQKLYHKIDACTDLLRVPRENSIYENSIYVEVKSLYTTCVFIPVDLWDKIMETVKEAKEQYNKELDAL